MPSDIVDISKQSANMYGCQDCPKCGSRYRVPYQNSDGSLRIDCDDCGWTEPATRAPDE